METRIDLEKRGRAPDTILDLNLDNCKSTCIIGLHEFGNLDTLSLINVGLTSLQGFPKLPNLRKLELRDNHISGELHLLHTSPKLTHLNLSGNKLMDLDTLEPLKDLKYLKNLNLLNNETTSIENYREKVLSLLPSLKYLDGFAVDDQEIEDSVLEDKEEEQLDLNEEEVGLALVFKEKLADESEGDVNEGGGVDDEDKDHFRDKEGDGEDEDGEDMEVAQRGTKRKHEDEKGDGNQKLKLAQSANCH